MNCRSLNRRREVILDVRLAAIYRLENRSFILRELNQNEIEEARRAKDRHLTL